MPCTSQSAASLRRLIPFALGLLPLALLPAQTPSPHLHVDQFGYRPAAEKVAVVSDPQIGYNANLSYTPGSTLEVREEGTGNVVFTGAPTAFNGGATHDQSGDRGWWFDFSSVSAPGDYYVYDPSTGARSAGFGVSPEPYQQPLYHALRAFYYNRANVAKQAPHAIGGWTDGTSFLNPGQDADCRFYTARNDASTARDLSGGWFDAGDHNKYVTFAEIVVHDLLSAYEDNPTAFALSSNIPESGNALPDVLDEVKVETDWLLKMSAPDGSTIVKMGNVSYQQNTNTPPSANFDPRYYGPTCTAAEFAAAGMLAHAAIVFGQQPSMQAYANTLQTRAEACFAQALPELQAGTLQTDCDDGTIKAGDADRTVEAQQASAVVAAIYLRQLDPSNAAYDNVIGTYLPPLPWHNGYYWSPYESHVNTALLTYMGDATASAPIVNQLTTALQSTVDNQAFMGWNARDLYRASIPDWAYHWGSNQPKARMALLNLQAERAGFVHGSGHSLTRRATQMLHYFHGVNPLGLVMLSNMNGAGAERSVNEIYHAWFWDGSIWENALTSPYGPAPGFVTGGPNDSYENIGAHDPNLVPPVGQPAQKSYLDDNDNSRPGGGDNAIYAINEPAIYYQSAYIRLLSYFAGANAPLPAELLAFTAEPEGPNVELAWSVGAQTNVSRYEVQRSLDAASYTALGSVDAGAANSDYAFTDTAPVAGVQYYRLAVVDADGDRAFSPVRSVSFVSNTASAPPHQGCGEARLTVRPNPTTHTISVDVPTTERVASVTLSDASGRTLLSRTFNPNTALPHPLDFDVAHLPNGTYSLRLTCINGERTLPFVKD